MKLTTESNQLKMYTGLGRCDLGILPDVVRFLVDMIEQIDNGRPDPHLPRWCWESRECYSIGEGSLSFTRRPQLESPEIQLLIRLKAIDVFNSGFEDHPVVRFLRDQRERADFLTKSYGEMLATVGTECQDETKIEVQR